MDEPLSNLDAKLRVQMRAEVARIQQRLGTTTVYVTHDQTEAMTLGDRVAVMRAGVIQQVDAPQNLYDNPVNLFVAGFIGSPAMNFLPAELTADGVRLPFGDVKLTDRLRRAAESSGGAKQAIAGIRPEAFEDAELVGGHRGEGFTFDADIELTESMGSEIYAFFGFEGEAASSDQLQELAQDAGAAEVPSSGAGHVVARLAPESRAKPGERLKLWLDTEKLQLFDARSGSNLSV
jgi:multiple sugar transport system ATP-binding protein